MSAVTAFLIVCAAGFAAGLLGALGLGGGGVLVIFLTVFLGVPQLRAQGINLLFFIPIGVFALIFHTKKGLVVFRAALPAAGLGLLGAAFGAMMTRFIGPGTIRVIFGVFLALLGAYELFRPHRRQGASSSPPPRRR